MDDRERAAASELELRDLIERWDGLVKATSDDAPATFLQPPATEADIAALEARLGTTLPPSYRAFLMISNGADAFPGWGSVSHESVASTPTGLRDAAAVDWIWNGDLLTVSIWTSPEVVDQSMDPDDHPHYVRQVPEREYLLDQGAEYPAGGAEKVGHFRHVLEVSSGLDGYATYLNPIVVDADGEWEAWDFGTKTLGAVRYRSFRALIEADIMQLEKRIAAGNIEEADLDRQLAVLVDRRLSPGERTVAAYALFWRDAFRDLVVEPLAEIALDARLDLGARQTAINVLGSTGTLAALATLARLATDPEPRIRISVAPALAASPEPVAKEATRALLTDPATPDVVFRDLHRCNDGVWDAWQDSHDRRLIVPLARCGDRRIVEPLAQALRDPDASEDERRQLVSTAASRLRDPRLVPALVAAAGFGGSYDRVQVARSLELLGATREAVALLRDVALRSPIDSRGAAESALAIIADPAAGGALLEILAASPTAMAVDALGWQPSPAAAAAIEPLLDDPDLHLVGIDALEVMHLPEATEVLARRSASADILATRALARLRDDRALAPLLALLADPDPTIAFRGSDGLRDLRDPRASDALLAAVDHADPEVAVCAAHALVAMNSPLSTGALSRLAANSDEAARELATRWQAARARRPAANKAVP